MDKGKKSNQIHFILWIVCLFPTGIVRMVCAQDTIPEIKNTLPSSNDTLVQAGDTSVRQLPTVAKDTVRRKEGSLIDDMIRSSGGHLTGDYGILPADSGILHAGDTLFFLLPDSARIALSQENEGLPAIKDTTVFKPNPKTAYLIAAVFPGFGQAYNRQYWKLPIVYGGLVGFMYAITWNNKVYQDYKRAYFDMRTDYQHYSEDPDQYGPDTWSTSWQDFFGKSRNSLLNQNYHTRLQKGRDYYRRYRDLSIILSVAFYAICIADAYVDAQMFDFDVSPDLSFRMTPEFYPSTLAHSRSFGFTVCMTF
jgi:hypothetical protein